MLSRKNEIVEVKSLHPIRESIISKDEITGLKIDLNILTIEQFLKKYWSIFGARE